ncbi:DUF1876 domain-containing protein [Streptomyces sp. SID7805]|nr:DUF1876 domain-containing protein [Streptomyces sp. SID7805]
MWSAGLGATISGGHRTRCARRLPVTGTKSWQAQIDITETDSEVTAEARLSGANGAPLVGSGTALCNPADENVPAIGDELAVARALSHLSHQLLNAAADDIEAHTHKPVERLRP